MRAISWDQTVLRGMAALRCCRPMLSSYLLRNTFWKLNLTCCTAWLHNLLSEATLNIKYREYISCQLVWGSELCSLWSFNNPSHEISRPDQIRWRASFGNPSKNEVSSIAMKFHFHDGCAPFSRGTSFLQDHKCWSQSCSGCYNLSHPSRKKTFSKQLLIPRGNKKMCTTFKTVFPFWCNSSGIVSFGKPTHLFTYILITWSNFMVP